MPIKIKRLRIPYKFPNAKLMYSTNHSKRDVYNGVQIDAQIESLRKKGVYIAPEVW
jgi:hypothetical protein